MDISTTSFPENNSKALATADDLSLARPFLKWAGGKRQLLPILLSNLPASFEKYFEPMIGGGALYFSLQRQGAFISDVNEELINLYRVVQNEVEALITDLGRHKHDEEYFYELRNADRTSEFKDWGAVPRASRFIYLNRTCFNGLYRVNSSGYFNVPFGRYKNPRIIDPENLRASSQLLQSANISLDSFELAVSAANRGDFVYFDPPYAPLNETSKFTSYTGQGFGAEQQLALRDCCIELDRRGVHFLLSNSSAPLILELYQGFTIQLVNATRAINSNATRRGEIKEVLVKNY